MVKIKFSKMTNFGTLKLILAPPKPFHPKLAENHTYVMCRNADFFGSGMLGSTAGNAYGGMHGQITECMAQKGSEMT